MRDYADRCCEFSGSRAIFDGRTAQELDEENLKLADKIARPVVVLSYD